MYLYAFLFAQFLKLFPCIGHIRDYYGDVLFAVVCWTVVGGGGVSVGSDLLHHINSQDPHIQFTVEPTQQGSLPFLDTLVTIEPDNTFSTTVYRKPTHTDQYLHWDSNHHITAKQSVYNTLAHRAKIVSSTQDKLGQGSSNT